jgi:thioredoxin-like negative regulator of GroEL
MSPDLRPETEILPGDLLGGDDGRIDLVCIRPPGPFKTFDDRLTQVASRFVRLVRVTIVRSWDFAAQHDWAGFVSRTVPTVLLVRAGRVVSKSVGCVPDSELRELICGVAH